MKINGRNDNKSEGEPKYMIQARILRNVMPLVESSRWWLLGEVLSFQTILAREQSVAITGFMRLCSNWSSFEGSEKLCSMITFSFSLGC